jgi:hypothetical protein
MKVETKFAMPVHAEYGPLFPHPILPEPFVIHRDHDDKPGRCRAIGEDPDLRVSRLVSPRRREVMKRSASGQRRSGRIRVSLR